MYKTFYEQKECVAFIESCGRIAKNTDYVNQCSPSKAIKNLKNHCKWITIFLLSKATKLEESFCILLMLELSGMTIVSPRGFFPLSLAPRRLWTRELRHSQSCRRQTYLYNLETKVTCVRSDSSYMILLYTRDKHKSIRTSSTPADQQICCHCYSKGCQPVGKGRKASCKTLDANWEDLQNAKFWSKPSDCLQPVPKTKSTCSRIMELWIWTVLFGENLKLRKRHLMRYSIHYALRYYTSDIMIQGMAPIPKEKAMT